MDLVDLLMWAIFWMALSVVLFFIWENRKTNNAWIRANKIVKDAEQEKHNLITSAENKANSIIRKY